MNSLPIYLGYKYFRSKKGAFASFTSLMAIAGLSLGVAALAGTSESIFNTSSIFGFLAISLAAINIFGGFLVTQRMLAMYKKKKKDK